ncbi:MAG: flagellar hook-basal body complex protein [Lachnospiraceae bacterium]|nr:flagellar hook-basal body complex protein [Lachnospiraceae bacterium]
MMRSLYSGVAGLKTHQTKMDVIGNNIANVNTTAFKSSSIVFSELMSQTTQRASGPNAATGTGGTNARQIGLGVKSGAININIEGQGSSQSTGNPFDIMITGDNFFVVNNGNGNYFTRDGSFYVDGAGNLAMTSTGYNVMGWGVDAATGNIKQDTVTALRIMSAANMTYPPEATSEAYVSGILDRNDKDVSSANGKAVNLNFFDALGYSYTARLVFKQSADENAYSVELTKLLDASGEEMDISALKFGDTGRLQEKQIKVQLTDGYYWDGKKLMKEGETTPVVDLNTPIFADEQGTLVKDVDGTGATLDTTNDAQAKLDLIAKAYGYEGSTEEFLNLYQKNTTAGSAGEAISIRQRLVNLQYGTTPVTEQFDTGSEFTADGRFFDGATLNFDPDTGKFAGINGTATKTSVTLDLSGLGGNFSNINIDFSESSGFDNKGTSTIGATSGDFDGLGAGRRLGDMIGVSIQNNGMIYASYDNGMTKLLGQIATANFANASGLEKSGDNLYAATLNSGEFDGIGVDVTANGGYMSTGQLEMSNVDLSAEFTEMITTQRGFQANSRIITVSDTLLEELTNLKR